MHGREPPEANSSTPPDPAATQAGSRDPAASPRGERRLASGLAAREGTRITDSLRLVTRLGKGGMGEVWRAKDEVLRRDVAVKLLPAARLDDEHARSRMLREARAQAALSHPNVCAILQAGEGPDGVWIVMELLEGPTLETRAAQGDHDIAAVARWGAQMAAGLAAAHTRGLVHRDVKPANAMFDANGTLKLVDFGLVKQVDSSTRDGQPRSVLTSEGAIIGSPAYMSPEQVRGAALGPATDVFSLGVVLYELACGVRPFGGATPVEAMAAILRDRPQPLRERVRSVPSPLANLIDACLAAEPHDRPLATAIASALQKVSPAHARSRDRTRGLLVLVGLAGVASFAVLRGDDEAGSAATASERVVDASAETEPMLPPPPSMNAAATVAPFLRDEIRIASGGVLAVTYDEAGTLWFTEGRGLAKRLYRRPEGGAPEFVPTQSFITSVACCSGGRIVAYGREGATSIDPATLTEHAAGVPFDSPTPAWSGLTRDGRHVAYSQGLSLTLHDPATGEQAQRDLGTELGFSDNDQRSAGPLEWSPDGRWLAAFHFGPPHPDPEEEVMLVDPRQPGRSIDLLHVDAPSLGPVGSALGLAWIGPRRLLVAQGTARPRWIDILVSEDGTVLRKAEHDLGGRLLEPRSAHGDEIAYRELHTIAEPLVLTLEEDGTVAKPEAIETNGAVERIGGWLADGRLVYSRRNDATDAVELVAARPGGSEQTIHPESAGGRALALAVVGDEIVHRLTNHADPSSAIWVARSDFTKRRKLDGVPGESEVSCSSGGCLVAVFEETFDDRLQHVHVLDVDQGTVGERLLTVPDARFLAWRGRDFALSDDGRYVAIATSHALWVLDRRTRKIDKHEDSGLRGVVSVDFDGPDILVTEQGFVGGRGLLRVAMHGRIDVLDDGGSYYGPVVDRARRRLVVLRTQYRADLLVAHFAVNPP